LVKVRGIDPEFLEPVLVKFEEAGATVERGDQWIGLKAASRPRGIDVTTLPHPGFPTDMQAQFMAVMCMADGVSVVTETVFENRYMHVPELARLGADITIKGKAAIIKGKLVAPGVIAMAVPGSTSVKRMAEREGLDQVFKDAGFFWGESGCSMCAGGNGDRGKPQERIVSTTNRNFEGRQGKGVRTHLSSVEVAAATAIAGVIADPRTIG
jgi:hypothetical protein